MYELEPFSERLKIALRQMAAVAIVALTDGNNPWRRPLLDAVSVTKLRCKDCNSPDIVYDAWVHLNANVMVHEAGSSEALACLSCGSSSPLGEFGDPSAS